MTDTNREALLRRIRGLAAKTVAAGCTEDEALSAASLLAKLIDRYGFTPADLNEPMEKLTDATVSMHGTAAGRNLYAVRVAGYCDCEVFNRTRADDTKELVFFGHETDVLMAGYLMDLLGSASNSGYKDFRAAEKAAGRQTDKRAAERRAFDWGFAARINARLTAMKSERSGAVDDATGKTGGALVAVKNAVVTEAFAARFGKMKDARPNRPIRNAVAYGAGKAAGDRAAINPGIGAGSQLRLK